MDKSQVVLLVATVTVAVIAALLYRWVRIRRLPIISAEAFLESFSESDRSMFNPNRLLRERELVAAVLSIPPERLSPALSTNDIRRLFLLPWEFYVAWGDLQDELDEDRRTAGLPSVELPDQIGSLIRSFAEIDVEDRSRR